MTHPVPPPKRLILTKASYLSGLLHSYNLDIIGCNCNSNYVHVMGQWVISTTTGHVMQGKPRSDHGANQRFIKPQTVGQA